MKLAVYFYLFSPEKLLLTFFTCLCNTFTNFFSCILLIKVRIPFKKLLYIIIYINTFVVNIEVENSVIDKTVDSFQRHQNHTARNFVGTAPAHISAKNSVQKD